MPQAGECGGDESPVVLDAEAVGQILFNLTDNAVKYGDGEVSVVIERREGRIRFTVRDEGPGVAPGEVGSIFAAFQRGRAAQGRGAGVGLGLALCRRWGAGDGGGPGSDPGFRGGVSSWICPGVDFFGGGIDYHEAKMKDTEITKKTHCRRVTSLKGYRELASSRFHSWSYHRPLPPLSEQPSQ